jgi:hypothetical protein
VAIKQSVTVRGLHPMTNREHLADAAEPNLVFGIELQADCRVPVHAPGTQVQTVSPSPRWRQGFESALLQPKTDEERSAWFLWCQGHHHVFLYWQVMTLLCEQATAALDQGDFHQAVLLVGRVATLTRGNAAAMIHCGSVEPGVYNRFLRPSMARARPDFSAASSADLLVMVTAKARLLEVLHRAEKAGTSPLAQAEADLHRAERYWSQRHAEIIARLHPGHSLLQEKIESLAFSGTRIDYQIYIDRIIHAQSARDDYDHYFGVARSPRLTLEAYWTMALSKLERIHRQLALPAPALRWLMQGDSLLLAVISEQLSQELAGGP